MKREEQYIDNKVSSTASFVTYFRACSYKEKNKYYHGPDYLAQIFHIGISKLFLVLSKIFLPLARRKVPGHYEFIIARTFILDKIFQNALDNNFDQIIILGAGFDTRSYRFINRIINTNIFELDLGPTQNIKRKCLEKSKVTIPKNLKYISINFNKEDLNTVLLKNGFQKSKKNLFVWEGVTEYLDPSSVDSTLKFIKDNSAAGSIVAFTYIYQEILNKDLSFLGSKEIIKTVSKEREPYQFGIKRDSINAFLKERDFEITKNYNSHDMEDLCFKNEKGEIINNICGHQCIAVASVICRKRVFFPFQTKNTDVEPDSSNGLHQLPKD